MALRSCCKMFSGKRGTRAGWSMVSRVFRSACRWSWKRFSKWIERSGWWLVAGESWLRVARAPAGRSRAFPLVEGAEEGVRILEAEEIGRFCKLERRVE